MDCPIENKISGLVITLNEEQNIQSIINNLDFVDEIIIIDSYSSDRTVEIVKANSRVRLVQNTFKNYSALRNLALGYASFPWILFLDADERIPEPLIQEIISTANEEKANDAYFFSESLCSIALLWNLADGKPTKTSDYLKKKRRAI